MSYKYLLEENAVNNSIKVPINKNIHILCYHINNSCKYPFLQFMMIKNSTYDSKIDTQLTLPHIVITSLTCDIKSIILKEIVFHLNINNSNINKIIGDNYKGIININDTYCALVNISNIDINNVNEQMFVLTSEIINTKMFFNISISEKTIQLFLNNPYIGILTNKLDELYIIPDVVYTCGEIKKEEFYSLFGNIRSKIYKSCSKYYYFYRNLKNAINSFSDNVNNKNLEGGVTRYALFVEGKIYYETDSECSLTDDIIDIKFPEPTIIISYIKYENKKQDIIVKYDNSFTCLKTWKLNMKI